MQPTDGELVQACLRGEQAAWNTLIERYGRLVYSIPRKLGFGPTEADDVFQTVFGIVFRRLQALRDDTRLSAWLIRTTYRECWRMKRGRGADRALDDSYSAEGVPAEEVVLREERQQIVRQALTQIDARCRELLSALFLEAEPGSYDAISARLGMPVGSIGPTRARCFKKLEDVLRVLGL